MTTIDILDRISPDEAHLSPSARTWARLIRAPSVGDDVLELRDLNDGQGWDPAEKARHQYAIARGVLWARRLPPAPLDTPEDETAWIDDPGAGRWYLVAPAASVPWEWARSQGVQPYPIDVRVSTVERDIHGDGGGTYTAYVMPPAHPVDRWADITSSPRDGHVVLCPVAGCGQQLVWYEAGYVPGYRVCMRPRSLQSYDPASLRHRFVLDHGRGTVLILDADAD